MLPLRCQDFQLLWDGAKPLNALNPSESGNCPRLRVVASRNPKSPNASPGLGLKPQFHFVVVMQFHCTKFVR